MKNKLLNLGVGLLFCLVLVTSCAPDYQTDFEVKTLEIANRDLSPIHFSIEGGQKEVKVETNVPLEMWKASSNSDWCKVTKNQDKVTISADQNDMYVTRRAVVTVAYGYQSYSIDVMQTGHEASISISDAIKNVTVNGGEVTFTVESNVVIDNISIPDTTTWVKMVGSVVENGTQKTLRFALEPSYAAKKRYSTITVQSSQDFSKVTTLVISQDPRIWGEPIPVLLTIDMLSANATEPNEGSLAALLDNDKATFYHTLWSATSPGGKPHYLQINLSAPLRFLRFEYDGRSNGNNGDPTRVGIWVSETGTAGDEGWTKATTITFTLRAGNGNHYVANEVANLGKPYKYIRFTPEARRNADPINSSGTNGWWYASNFFLYTFAE